MSGTGGVGQRSYKLRSKRPALHYSPFTIRVSDSFRGTKQLGKSEILRDEELSWKRASASAPPTATAGFLFQQGLMTTTRRNVNSVNWELWLLEHLSPELGRVLWHVALHRPGCLCFLGSQCSGANTESLRRVANLSEDSFIISSNPGTLPRMRWTRFAAFLPFVFAAWRLWFALHG